MHKLETRVLTPQTFDEIARMLEAGYTRKEIAKAIGASISHVEFLFPALEGGDVDQLTMRFEAAESKRMPSYRDNTSPSLRASIELGDKCNREHCGGSIVSVNDGWNDTERKCSLCGR